MTETATAPDYNAKKVALLLVSGLTETQAINTAQEKLGLDADQAQATVREAKRLITVAADYNREAEIGTAITRLNDVYSRALKVQDLKTALATQRELDKLMGLHADTRQAEPDGANVDTGESESAKTLAAARRYLEPLGLTDLDTPVDELARLAAARIIALESEAG